ncbi:MAG: 4Fe-4S cluster-binding domain-containing protein [Spirochaetia bacterium]|nr:4Fe-4S cluster-binding domain-containing protein [Spirochaetia bacterium]
MQKIKISSFLKKKIKKNHNNCANIWKKQLYYNRNENDDNYALDPLLEESIQIRPNRNIIHKYPGKILILLTDKCAVYCRYCTRKRDKTKKRRILFPSSKIIIDYLIRNSNIHEIIFSGGDPFMVQAEKLFKITKEIASLEQIKFIRFHTRCATVNPEIFSPRLFNYLLKLKTNFPQKNLCIVFHINHIAEISEETINIFYELNKIKYNLYCQSVLLKNINDNANTLNELYTFLYHYGVIPYYIHQLDKTKGSKYFEVSVSKGKKIMRELKSMLPTYLLPRYVEDSFEGKKNLFY